MILVAVFIWRETAGGAGSQSALYGLLHILEVGQVKLWLPDPVVHHVAHAA